MSYVTTVIVSSNCFLDDDRKYISDFMHQGSRLPFDGPNSCEDFVGTKCAEAAVLLGAFNYFDAHDFIDHLKKRDWSRSGISVVAWINGDFLAEWHQVPEEPRW